MKFKGGNPSMEPIILFLIGIILIVFNIRAIHKEKNSFQTKLDQKKESTRDVDVEIGKLRRDFGETIFELQKEIKKNDGKSEITEQVSKFENYNNVKIDEIKKMLDGNVSIDEISKITGIGKGELLLIEELYIK